MRWTMKKVRRHFLHRFAKHIRNGAMCKLGNSTDENILMKSVFETLLGIRTFFQF